MNKNINWQKEDDSYLLKSNTEVLLSLQYEFDTRSTFKIAGVEYFIERKGIWVPGYSITANGAEILKITHGFWGSSGTAVFADGSVYRIQYNSNQGFKITFLDQDREVLVYGTMFENHRPKMVFSLGSVFLEEEKLLILAAVGFIMFYAVFRENSASGDVITLVM